MPTPNITLMIQHGIDEIEVIDRDIICAENEPPPKDEYRLVRIAVDRLSLRAEATVNSERIDWIQRDYELRVSIDPVVQDARYHWYAVESGGYLAGFDIQLSQWYIEEVVETPTKFTKGLDASHCQSEHYPPGDSRAFDFSVAKSKDVMFAFFKATDDGYDDDLNGHIDRFFYQFSHDAFEQGIEPCAFHYYRAGGTTPDNQARWFFYKTQDHSRQWAVDLEGKFNARPPTAKELKLFCDTLQGLTGIPVYIYSSIGYIVSMIKADPNGDWSFLAAHWLWIADWDNDPPDGFYSWGFDGVSIHQIGEIAEYYGQASSRVDIDYFYGGFEDFAQRSKDHRATNYVLPEMIPDPVPDPSPDWFGIKQAQTATIVEKHYGNSKTYAFDRDGNSASQIGMNLREMALWGRLSSSATGNRKFWMNFDERINYWKEHLLKLNHRFDGKPKSLNCTVIRLYATNEWLTTEAAIQGFIELSDLAREHYVIHEGKRVQLIKFQIVMADSLVHWSGSYFGPAGDREFHSGNSGHLNNAFYAGGYKNNYRPFVQEYLEGIRDQWDMIDSIQLINETQLSEFTWDGFNHYSAFAQDMSGFIAGIMENHVPIGLGLVHTGHVTPTGADQMAISRLLYKALPYVHFVGCHLYPEYNSANATVAWSEEAQCYIDWLVSLETKRPFEFDEFAIWLKDVAAIHPDWDGRLQMRNCIEKWMVQRRIYHMSGWAFYFGTINLGFGDNERAFDMTARTSTGVQGASVVPGLLDEIARFTWEVLYYLQFT